MMMSMMILDDTGCNCWHGNSGLIFNRRKETFFMKNRSTQRKKNSPIDFIANQLTHRIEHEILIDLTTIVAVWNEL